MNSYSCFANFESDLKENAWVLGSDFFTEDHLYCGGMGEKVGQAATQMNFKRKDGFHVKANRFNDQYRYCCGYGMDIIIEDMRNGYAAIAALEIKNLADQRKPYGTDFVIKQVLSRSADLNPLVKKILVITFEHLLTKTAKQLLTQEGWEIIEVGERLTANFFSDLSKLYKLSTKIKKAVQSAIKPKPAIARRAFFVYNKNRDIAYNTIDQFLTINTDIIPIENPYDTPLLTSKIHDAFTDNMTKLMPRELSLGYIYS